MATLTQDARAFRVDTPLGDDVLLLQRFEGSEGVSTPFLFTLDLLSEDDAIDPADLLREPVVVTVVLAGGGERKIHGRVRRFLQLGQQDGLTFYKAEVVPWLWFLGLSHDCRIFQNMPVPDIATQVFDDLGYPDYEVRCTQSYEPREYCVQYRESHLNFVSRLFEEEGIFYFFEHTDDKHLLVLADDNSAVQPCPGQEVARMASDVGPYQEEDVVRQFRLESSVHIGEVTLRDYDFTRPSLGLESAASGEGQEEVYDYPGRYVDLSNGDRYTQLLLEEGQRDAVVARGAGTCRAMRSGFSFELEEHYRSDANCPYMLVHVEHRGEAGDYRSWSSAPLEYTNDFVAIPTSTPYRPPRTSRRPRIHGSQTAVVVGKSDEEIHTDGYGRVKVQFHWDREGTNDENSSCWIRVSYPWAGKAWGGIHIPRIGQEVIVEFLEGDPDRPIITGRVYNAEQTVPYGLPGSKTQSGFKSRSSKGGGTSNFNEIRMEDKKGSEQLYIHAEKDKQVVVENDRSESVGHDETISIGNDRTEDVGNDETISIGNNRTETVAASESVKIGADRSETIGTTDTKDVGSDETTTVGANRSITVGADHTETVAANFSLTVGGDASLSVGGSRSTTTGSDFSVSAGTGASIQAGTSVDITAGTKVSVTATAEIKLQVGGSFVKIDPSGVTIFGPIVKIN